MRRIAATGVVGIRTNAAKIASLWLRRSRGARMHSKIIVFPSSQWRVSNKPQDVQSDCFEENTKRIGQMMCQTVTYYSSTMCLINKRNQAEPMALLPCWVFTCGYKMAQESQEQSWPIKHH